MVSDTMLQNINTVFVVVSSVDNNTNHMLNSLRDALRDALKYK